MSSEIYVINALRSSSWREEVKVICREYVCSRHPVIPSLEEVKAAVCAKARAKIPVSVKSELVRSVQEELGVVSDNSTLNNYVIASTD